MVSKMWGGLGVSGAIDGDYAGGGESTDWCKRYAQNWRAEAEISFDVWIGIALQSCPTGTVVHSGIAKLKGVAMINKLNTGVGRAKVQYKRVVLGFLGAAAAMVITIGFSAPAFATSIPANFPGNNGTSCNAWHGAPGGFGPDSPYYTVSGPQGGIGGYTFGQAQGVITGQNNSGYAAGCNQ